MDRLLLCEEPSWPVWYARITECRRQMAQLRGIGGHAVIEDRLNSFGRNNRAGIAVADEAAQHRQIPKIICSLDRLMVGCLYEGTGVSLRTMDIFAVNRMRIRSHGVYRSPNKTGAP
ncbi:hypothetical protein CHY08_13850 [Rhizobium leguminosarum bv. viciae]|nr:hypothetical protein CHY08_13850 [Rhizobium leguminosarum bv. viciae]